MVSYGPDLKLASTMPRGASAVGSLVSSVDTLSPERIRFAEAQGFEAKPGQAIVVPVDDGPMEVLVGIAASDDHDDGDNETTNNYRLAGAAFARAVNREKAVAFSLPGDAAPDHVTALTEGMGLGSYRYTAQQGTGTAAKPVLSRITLVGRPKGAAAAFALGQQMVTSVALARDLINEPGGSLLPTEFVRKARAAAKGSERLKVTVWDKKRIEKERLGGLLSVNKGSVHPPALLMLTYTPATKKRGSKTVALVGKGITFDSGGLSIKSGAGMMTMKIDMAGGASVLGAMTLLEAMNCPNTVNAYIPLTDNMPSGDATRPGDVYTARNGMTVEVLNTDAEGRLVLADALALAAEKKPAAIVDIATLTGSVTAALGPKYTGLMGSDDGVMDVLKKSAETTGEKLWQLPLPVEYRKDLDSDIADLRNIGKTPYGGALTAGLFLKEFVGEVPWAHLDLGLAAMADGDDGVITKGGTGTCTRTLATFATNF